MDREQVIATLRAHEAELRAAGVERLSVFGSVARGDQTESSDVDVAIRLSPEAAQGGFAYFGHLDALTRSIRDILGCSVDFVTEGSKTSLIMSPASGGSRAGFPFENVDVRCAARYGSIRVIGERWSASCREMGLEFPDLALARHRLYLVRRLPHSEHGDTSNHVVQNG